MAAQFNLHGARAAALFAEIIRSPNLISLWPTNEKSGTIIDRVLANRYNSASVGGNPAYSKAIGTHFWALDFDGTGDYVDFGSPANIAFERTSSFSALALVDPNVSAIGTFLSKFDLNTPRGWEWAITAARLPFVNIQNGAGNQLQSTSNAALTNGADVMIGFTYDGSSGTAGLILYKNGVVDASTNNANTLSATILAPDYTVQLGAASTGQMINGDIGFVALWGRAVTPGEMRRYAFLAGFL